MAMLKGKNQTHLSKVKVPKLKAINMKTTACHLRQLNIRPFKVHSLHTKLKGGSASITAP